MLKRFIFLCVVVLLLGIAGGAEAVSFDIYAYNNALLNTPLNTGIDVSIGDYLSIEVDPTDTWSAGNNIPVSRISNADGLRPGNPYGGSYPLYTNSGFSFYYGSLVGRIGSGDYFLVGTDYDSVATAAGTLYLLYWDSNFYDNSGYVTADVMVEEPYYPAVPEPSTLLLLGAGLAGVALAGRRFRK